MVVISVSEYQNSLSNKFVPFRKLPPEVMLLVDLFCMACNFCRHTTVDWCELTCLLNKSFIYLFIIYFIFILFYFILFYFILFYFILFIYYYLFFYLYFIFLFFYLFIIYLFFNLFFYLTTHSVHF